MMTASLPISVDLSAWPGAALRVSRDGEIVASNGRLDALLGADVVGRAITDLLDRDSSVRKWTRLGKGETSSCELIFATDEQMLETSIFSVLPGEEGDVCLVEHPTPPRMEQLGAEMAAVNTDLSVAQRALVIERGRLSRALKEIERSNLALDEFAHVVSHDLKAPLRAIRDYAELLSDDTVACTDDERAEYFQRIADLTQRMRRMIDAALEYARVGRMTSRLEPVDTGILLRDIVAFLAPPKDVTIRIAANMPVIGAERVPLEQVLRNLISNAISYRRETGAEIDVSAKDAGDAWELAVRDNGPGIAASQHERIWRLFHTSRPGEGTGLGLALVKRIVEAQGGTIALDSDAGRGATFTVKWPRQ